MAAFTDSSPLLFLYLLLFFFSFLNNSCQLWFKVEFILLMLCPLHGSDDLSWRFSGSLGLLSDLHPHMSPCISTRLWNIITCNIITSWFFSFCWWGSVWVWEETKLRRPRDARDWTGVSGMLKQVLTPYSV